MLVGRWKVSGQNEWICQTVEGEVIEYPSLVQRRLYAHSVELFLLLVRQHLITKSKQFFHLNILALLQSCL